MTPARARATWRRQITKHGETVVLRRVVDTGPNIEKTVRAKVAGYEPDELGGNIQQGDRKIIVLEEDVAAQGFPVPFKENSVDKVVVRGKTTTIQAVDDNTIRVAGQLIGYVIRSRG